VEHIHSVAAAPGAGAGFRREQHAVCEEDWRACATVRADCDGHGSGGGTAGNAADCVVWLGQ